MSNTNIFELAQDLLQQVEQFTTNNTAELEKFRIAYLGSNGKVKQLFEQFKSVPNERKKEFGQIANQVKQTAEAKIEQLKAQLETATDTPTDIPDLTVPALTQTLGSRHPVSLFLRRAIDVFRGMGFAVVADREIEDDWHNFTALNTPDDHPSRDMQDTFYIQTNPAVLLRTHTSPVQARHMEKNQPPIRIVAPGRVYRNETVSARSHCQFHQIEGLYVGENVSLADLKQTLLVFARQMFSKDVEIRLRPSFFPFTEPSLEADVTCFICQAKGCPVCKYSGWVEILGAGMVDPNVLENCGIDSKKYTGFAFGMGIERTTMQLYGIKDIRLLFENDVRFLRQFSGGL